MTAPIDLDHFKARLLALEQTHAARADRAIAAGRGEFIDVAHDSGDASVANEIAAEKFTEAELDSDVLAMIHAALARIQDGTYGTCLVDGGPIERKRLEAVPWTPYCLTHADRAAGETGARRTTL